MNTKSILLLGSVALDSIETKYGSEKDILGGSASYAAFSSSPFSITLTNYRFCATSASPRCQRTTFCWRLPNRRFSFGAPWSTPINFHQFCLLLWVLQASQSYFPTPVFIHLSFSVIAHDFLHSRFPPGSEWWIAIAYLDSWWSLINFQLLNSNQWCWYLNYLFSICIFSFHFCVVSTGFPELVLCFVIRSSSVLSRLISAGSGLDGCLSLGRCCFKYFYLWSCCSISHSFCIRPPKGSVPLFVHSYLIFLHFSSPALCCVPLFQVAVCCWTPLLFDSFLSSFRHANLIMLSILPSFFGFPPGVS